MFERLCGCCSRAASSSEDVIRGEEERRLRANDRVFNSQFRYAGNYIKTSKYNLITFIPQNLFEQFQRIANFYFLVLMILQFIPQISSISWYSTAIPLVIVLAFSAVKDGYDDMQRHISDRNVNGRKSFVVRNGHLNEEEWEKVKVGDVIRMMSNQFVAADLLLLSTSEPHGICYIETMELDGETNLKTRGAVGETAEMGDDLDAISKFDGEIVCEAPNNRLDKFNGKLIWQGKELPITNENILLRGCILKNTRWCYGLVIFAGKDTKLMMNSGKAKFKRTSLDRFLNILIMGIVLFLIAMCLICTILCGVWEWTTGRWFTDYLPWDDIVPNRHQHGSQQIAVISFLMFFSYVILLNTVVPISLYVSVEIIRFIHSLWINYKHYLLDQEMYYENGENSVPARAHTTTLNEELGQNTKPIDFSWNPHYESTFMFYDKKLLDDTKKGVSEVTEFWRLLALCHTVMPERNKGQLVYQAQSPDEAALTSAARNFGYVFRGRTPQSITIEVMGKEEVYELLCILDFNNDRKRMSVITRNSQGKIRLYCKGADMMIMASRQIALGQIAKLQDGVPEAIARLAEANIKIWVLTGDKTETAINIAYSCRLLTDDMKEIVVIDGQTHSEVEVQLKDTKTTFDRIMNHSSNGMLPGDKPRFEIETIHGEGQPSTIDPTDIWSCCLQFGSSIQRSRRWSGSGDQWLRFAWFRVG
ncbi:hypothetical protein GCK32_010306 [Trichostrongylus colubriformis]|uniref:P-type ATPase N-terminal domain-containing protein n=1 Tax=Trichostrongylus colubriformis TaxID=6319 RepID=A0AAN8FMJ0_TRICO